MAKKKIRDTIFPAVISLALAFLLWMVVSGQDRSIFELHVKLEYANFPTKLALDGSLPDTATVKVLANPAQIKFLEDRKHKINIDLSQAKSGLNNFDLNTDDLGLPRGVQIQKVIPSNIIFECSPIITKNITIKPQISGQLKDGLALEKIEVVPNIVELSGPEEIINTIDEITTSTIDLSHITESRSIKVLPSITETGNAPRNSISVKPKEVMVNIEVKVLTTNKTFKVPVNIINDRYLENSDQIVLSPSTVQVTLQWPSYNKLKISSDDLNAVVDLSTFKASDSGLSMPLEISSPEQTQIISVSPEEVKVILNNNSKNRNNTNGS